MFEQKYDMGKHWRIKAASQSINGIFLAYCRECPNIDVLNEGDPILEGCWLTYSAVGDMILIW